MALVTSEFIATKAVQLNRLFFCTLLRFIGRVWRPLTTNYKRFFKYFKFNRWSQFQNSWNWTLSLLIFVSVMKSEVKQYKVEGIITMTWKILHLADWKNKTQFTISAFYEYYLQLNSLWNPNTFFFINRGRYKTKRSKSFCISSEVASHR